MNFTCQLAACTNTLLSEIAEPRLKRKDIAMTYMLAMRSSEPTDWAKVNAAILDRWSMSGLIWIKTQAHRLLRPAE